MAKIKTKRNKKEAYKKRQNILLIIIGIILVIAILIAVYFIAFNDKKTISQSPSESVNSEALAVDGQEATITYNNVSFASNTLTVEVGKSITPEFSDGSAKDVTKWESNNESVAIVSQYGDITGISVGIAKINAYVKNSDEILTLTVDVIPCSDGSFSMKGYKIVEKEGLTYIDDILIANKSYSLPMDYEPGIDYEAENAFYEMQSNASYEGLDIYIASGFRSYEDQDRIYNNYASYDGYEAADTYSARPGHSEHQTGLAFDLNSIETSFADTAEGQWIKDNAHKYGFIIRYPEGKEDITGYMYEPWHIRYLGIEKATEVYESGLTLEEFLGIDSVYAESDNSDSDYEYEY